MKYLFLFFAILFSVNALLAQSFPQSFIGHWKGEISWYQPGKKAPQKFAAQLKVAPTDTAGQYTWQIIYGKEEKDNRPYILRSIDTAKGHWVIDEKNGIVLDQYWVGNTFSGAFALDAVTIINSYRLEKEKLIINFFTVNHRSVNKTGSGTEASPAVNSYRLSGYQVGILTRTKSAPLPLRKSR
jgi:hypothetical protein